MRNRKPDHCKRCGTWIKAQEGNLIRCIEGCDRHMDYDGWHVLCLDEIACSARKEERKREQLEQAARLREQALAEQKAADAEVAAYNEFRDKTVDGLVNITSPPPNDTLDGSWAVIAQDTVSWYRRTLYIAKAGDTVVYREDHTGYDDWRTAYWVPRIMAIEWTMEAALAGGLTEEQARSYLVHYGGCWGADYYKIFLAERERINAERVGTTE